eukprot:10834504-Heterocapsa_arctica.AAC.1
MIYSIGTCRGRSRTAIRYRRRPVRRQRSRPDEGQGRSQPLAANLAQAQQSAGRTSSLRARA